MADLHLRSVTLPDGTVADVVLDATAGTIASVEPPAIGDHDSTDLDLTGYLLLPAPAEPHAHLDKALTADLVPNPAGDLMGAIENWQAHYGDRTVEEITTRARAAALVGLANGATAIRTHVDINEGVDLRAVDALVEVKAELAHLVDLQIVGLVGRPLLGPEGRPNRDRLTEALDRGLDVVGGCPHLDADPHGVVDLCLALALERGVHLDLHMDENMREGSLDLEYLAQRALAEGTTAVTASHCCSLGIQVLATQQRVAEAVAAAGVSVVTLPQTNLFLQARGVSEAQPRGLTAVASLLDAGVNVPAGADNLQDPFNTVGRADPLETASLLVMAAHLTTDQAYHAISAAPRHALGLPPVIVTPGAPAELLAVKAHTLREAIAFAPADRLVFHRGRLVVRTTTHREVGESLS